MKRTWILLAALFALCLPCVHGTGAALEEDFNSPLSSAWRQTASGASITVEDGAVILQCDTSPDKTASAATAAISK